MRISALHTLDLCPWQHIASTTGINPPPPIKVTIIAHVQIRVYGVSTLASVPFKYHKKRTVNLTKNYEGVIIIQDKNNLWRIKGTYDKKN